MIFFINVFKIIKSIMFKKIIRKLLKIPYDLLDFNKYLK
jgi:hypothetical protein